MGKNSKRALDTVRGGSGQSPPKNVTPYYLKISSLQYVTSKNISHILVFFRLKKRVVERKISLGV